jgi:two-component system CitB family response regulator
VIRVLVVDDDFRIAELHTAYAARLPGFTVIGRAGTGAEAIRMVKRSKPDLVLLDIYLPDITGLEVLRTLRQPEMPPVDVIAITAARDIETLKAAMSSGIIHYLIKPFRFTTFKQKLESYAELREKMGRLGEADQKDVDRLYSLLRTSAEPEHLPKGLSRPTLELVEGCLRQTTEGMSAEEVAQLAGISRVTARRYLDHLARLERVDVRMRYGSRGRPEHRYRASSAAPAG